MAKKQVKQPKKSQKSIYLDNDLWDKIEDAAKKDRRSINTFLELKLEKEFITA